MSFFLMRQLKIEMQKKILESSNICAVKRGDNRFTKQLSMALGSDSEDEAEGSGGADSSSSDEDNTK